MPDIAKCRGGTCPLRDRCYRFLAEDSVPRQAYLPLIPYGTLHANYCEYYSPMEKELKT